MSDTLIDRLREMAALKYQFHTVHAPAVMSAAADRIESLEAELEQMTEFRDRAHGDLAVAQT